MSEIKQNSQEVSLPNTKSENLYQLVANQELPIITAVVKANLSHALSVYEEIQLNNSTVETLNSLLSLTSHHLFSIDALLDSAITIHSFAELQLCKRVANELNLTMQSICICSLTYTLKSDFIHGLYLTSKYLLERVDMLPKLVEQNKEIING
ncbi:hypothetical protein [Acinetobacter venetianus]|uniref:hypothetical protein n=1 Tax=Acinetobacter venetianus TaxID=52133 RepID=UPI00214FBC91|nr:hypothetical protein [Acinetobacter venetianus]MCR4532488.1 hypothetical protein [Acinetobacter venetianus]